MKIQAVLLSAVRTLPPLNVTYDTKYIFCTPTDFSTPKSMLHFFFWRRRRKRKSSQKEKRRFERVPLTAVSDKGSAPLTYAACPAGA